MVQPSVQYMQMPAEITAQLKKDDQDQNFANLNKGAVENQNEMNKAQSNLSAN